MVLYYNNVQGNKNLDIAYAGSRPHELTLAKCRFDRSVVTPPWEEGMEDKRVCEKIERSHLRANLQNIWDEEKFNFHKFCKSTGWSTSFKFHTNFLCNRVYRHPKIDEIIESLPDELKSIEHDGYQVCVYRWYNLEGWDQISFEIKKKDRFIKKLFWSIVSCAGYYPRL